MPFPPPGLAFDVRPLTIELVFAPVRPLTMEDAGFDGCGLVPVSPLTIDDAVFGFVAVRPLTIDDAGFDGCGLVPVKPLTIDDPGFAVAVKPLTNDEVFDDVTVLATGDLTPAVDDVFG